MLVEDGRFDLTYCTNIHPGESWAEVRGSLERHVPPLKARLRPDGPFGIGLRLGARAARDLGAGGVLGDFRDWLAAHGLYVAVINGFPYGGFHGAVVKDRAYAPDWRDEERLHYTAALAKILAALLPEGVDGGISTVPLSYKPWLKTPEDRQATAERCTYHLVRCVEALVRLRREHGVLLHLDIEPEPDCLLENGADVLDFYTNVLLPKGAEMLMRRLGMSRAAAAELLLEHLRLCYDACHFAVAFESPRETLARFAAIGIKIGRLQISSALHVDIPQLDSDRATVARHLREFAESGYLHQTVERRADGSLRHYPDLPAALANLPTTDARAWRVHFHVPVFLARYESVGSTQDDLAVTLDEIVAREACRHLEIETYTFDVLPEELRTNVVESIAREYDWVLGRLPRMRYEAAE